MAADTGETRVEKGQLKAVFRMGSRQYCAGVGDLVSIPDFPKASKDREQFSKPEIEIRADVLMITGDQTIIGDAIDSRSSSHAGACRRQSGQAGDQLQAQAAQAFVEAN